MIYRVTVGDRSMKIDVVRAADGWAVRVDGGPTRAFTGQPIGPAEWMLREGARSHRLGLALRGEKASLQMNGAHVAVSVVDPRDAMFDLADASEQGDVVTQMPGVVVRVGVAAGSAVRKGDVLLVVEAMKMENEFRAPMDGVVRDVFVVPGQAVQSGARLVHVEASS